MGAARFNAEEKRRFVAALERCGSIKAAAAEVGVGTGSVAWARRRDAEFESEVARVLGRWGARPPVPMARPDGFTPPKKRRFIRTLARTGCISDAARVAGVSRKTANDWRAKDPAFARLCTVAIDKAAGHLETLAWERAVTGIEEPIVHYGKLVGTRVKRSDAIFRLLLIGSNRKKYGTMGGAVRAAAAKPGPPAAEPVEFAPGEQETWVDRMTNRIVRLQERQIRDQGYGRGPDGALHLPGWGPVTEDAKRMAALPEEVWAEARRRHVLPRPDGTIPTGWSLFDDDDED